MNITIRITTFILFAFFIAAQAEAASIRYKGYTFNIEIVSDQTGAKLEGVRNRRPFILARPGERYSIRIHNPLPVRVGVNLTVDGLNTITGKPSSPSNGWKWVLAPNSSATIRGWQVSSDFTRRFFFTSKQESYAAWRSNSWARDLSVNCGVIGAAFFWNSKELNPPVIAPPLKSRPNSFDGRSSFDAGTGMGEREINQVDETKFTYDVGMYKPQDALLVYYDFSDKRRQPEAPKPFGEGVFAPEQD